MNEELLAGGDVNVVVRVGDTVRRPTGPWSPAAQALLHHFESAGFDGARELHRRLGGHERQPGGREMWDAGSGETALAGIRWLEDNREELERWL